MHILTNTPLYIIILIANLPFDFKKLILLRSSSLLLKNNSILGIDLEVEDDIVVSAFMDFCKNIKQSKKKMMIKLLLVCFIAIAIGLCTT